MLTSPLYFQVKSDGLPNVASLKTQIKAQMRQMAWLKTPIFWGRTNLQWFRLLGPHQPSWKTKEGKIHYQMLVVVDRIIIIKKKVFRNRLFKNINKVLKIQDKIFISPYNWYWPTILTSKVHKLYYFVTHQKMRKNNQLLVSKISGMFSLILSSSFNRKYYSRIYLRKIHAHNIWLDSSLLINERRTDGFRCNGESRWQITSREKWI